MNRIMVIIVVHAHKLSLEYGLRDAIIITIKYHHDDHDHHKYYNTCSLAGTEEWIGRVAKELLNAHRLPWPDGDGDGDGDGYDDNDQYYDNSTWCTSRP